MPNVLHDTNTKDLTAQFTASWNSKAQNIRRDQFVNWLDRYY